MRGDNNNAESMFIYLSPEALAPKNHPLRPIRAMADKALVELNGDFEAMYSRTDLIFYIRNLALLSLFDINSIIGRNINSKLIKEGMRHGREN